MRALLFVLCFLSGTLHAAEKGRFLYEGDGNITIINKNSGAKATVTYRNTDGSYNSSALDQINRVFNMPQAQLGEGISLRLISILDYLQDHYLAKQALTITSGYRSPTLNANLRKQGKTAGETSYHMDGMAADLQISQTMAEKIWDEFKEVKYGGVGIYGGSELHVDAGRPRFWTKATALPKDKQPQENKNVYLSIDKDIYESGEKMQLFFSGVSQYPIGVKKKLNLTKNGKTVSSFEPQFLNSQSTDSDKDCLLLENHKQARLIFWDIPQKISGNLNIEVEFCGPVTEKMPKTLLSRGFEIK